MSFVCSNCGKVCTFGTILCNKFFCLICRKPELWRTWSEWTQYSDKSIDMKVCGKCGDPESADFFHPIYGQICYNCLHFGNHGNYLGSKPEDP
jgi:hypothetical protein